MGKLSIKEAINSFILRLKNSFSIEKVILFGSQATNTQNKNSDVDLIIVSKDFEGMPFLKRGAKMYDYWNFEIPVDFICYSPSEFNLLKKRISLVSNALKEGLVLA